MNVMIVLGRENSRAKVLRWNSLTFWKNRKKATVSPV